MNNNAILAALDVEINKLQQARAMLSSAATAPAKKNVGHPKGSKQAPAKAAKRVLSEEARSRIAAAQKKRWAAAKKAAQ
ncbi:MAG: hypothetical protein ACRYGF_00535 [Janthinobacterium lividum]